MLFRHIAIALLSIVLVAVGVPASAQTTDKPSDGPKKPTCDKKDCD